MISKFTIKHWSFAENIGFRKQAKNRSCKRLRIHGKTLEEAQQHLKNLKRHSLLKLTAKAFL